MARASTGARGSSSSSVAILTRAKTVERTTKKSASTSPVFWSRKSASAAPTLDEPASRMAIARAETVVMWVHV